MLRILSGCGVRRSFLSQIFALAVCLAAVSSVQAANFVVNTDLDNESNGCAVSLCTLREAVVAANANAQADTITFNGSFFKVPRTIILNGAEIAFANDGAGNTTTIDGTNARFLTVSGNNASRVFNIANGAAVNFSDLQITGGNAEFGGGVYNDGGTVNLTNVTIYGNTASAAAGFRNQSGTATISNSTISGNTSPETSGVLVIAGTMTLINVTISGNSTNSTVVNSAGGVRCFGGTLNIVNSIIAGNTAGIGASPDVYGAFASGGNNLIGNTVGASGFVVSDIQNPVNGARLAPLGFYGGKTYTHAFLTNSPLSEAINGGIAASAPATDQRGAARSGAVDIGAVESNGAYIAALPNGTMMQAYNFTLVPNSGNYLFTTPHLPANGLSLTTAFAPSSIVSIVGTPPAPQASGITLTGADFTTGNAVNQVYSLAVFAPTAASVTVGGRVTAGKTRGVSRAFVYLTDSNGATRTALTNNFGYYRFADVPAGQTVTVNVFAKRYDFQPQIVTVSEETMNLDFAAQ